MTARPSLVRSIPFWILLVGSLASTIAGAWLVVTKISLMNSTLTDGSATGVEVYGGQAWVTLGAALVGAGLVGFIAALFLGVLRSFVPAARVEVADLTADDYADDAIVVTTDAAAPAAGYTPAAAPTSPAAGYTPAPAVAADEPVVVADEPAIVTEEPAPASSQGDAPTR